MLAVFGLGHWELLVVLIVALLIFGKRLPDVARNLGKGIVEFKKGVRGIEDDIDRESYPQIDSTPSPPYEDPAAHTESRAEEPERTAEHGQD